MCSVASVSCVRLCDPVDCSPPRSSVHGILQARVLERFAMPSSRRSSRCRDQTHVSCTSCIAGGFSTTEPLGRPIQEGCRVLQLCFSLVNLSFITGGISTSEPRSVEGKLFFFPTPVCRFQLEFILAREPGLSTFRRSRCREEAKGSGESWEAGKESKERKEHTDPWRATPSSLQGPFSADPVT